MNDDVKSIMKKRHVYQYTVAFAAGVSESTLIKWLRVPLEGERRKRVLDAIDKAAAEGEKG